MSHGSRYRPKAIFTDHFPGISGNAVNGLGETVPRRAAPFFWHKPALHAFGALQQAVTDYHRQSPEIAETYTPTADRGPKATARAAERVEKSSTDWTHAVKTFALENEADLVGIAAMDPSWVYEGFEISEPWVIVIGVAMDHDRLNQVPATFENPAAAVEVGDKYNKAARACRKLTNFILGCGYHAAAYQGPYANALNMIPAAIAAGFGELGKHGSLINRNYGSSFRLSAVTTDLPLCADQPDEFGADWFCHRCQVCTSACPPAAIFEEKQMVRGTRKWYVDFDKCIPYFGEALGCAICIARCPWSTPGRAPRLAERFARRSGGTAHQAAGNAGPAAGQ
jgi:epoxyqueuosine reductase QueG